VHHATHNVVKETACNFLLSDRFPFRPAISRASSVQRACATLGPSLRTEQVQALAADTGPQGCCFLNQCDGGFTHFEGEPMAIGEQK
jgi:hypothetical protein